jgi:ABC-type transport system involved in Fe-S cluster assembly fused permease/ATPase subunit
LSDNSDAADEIFIFKEGDIEETNKNEDLFAKGGIC